MKITKRQLGRIIREERSRLTKVREAKADGTISSNEDNERALLMAEVEETVEDLVRFIQTEAERIGGGFRSPGIKRQALKLAVDILHDYR